MARVEKRLTQEQLAAQIGVTTRQYSRIENGNSNGSLKVWEQIIKVLGGTIDDLYKNNFTR